MSDITEAQAPTGVGAGTRSLRGNYLYGPVIDFLTLGGGSLVILFGLVLVASDDWKPYALTFALLLANFINHPHFIHSYQIFYENFSGKAFSGSYAPGLRVRYIVSGIGVPLTMTLFFSYAVLAGEPKVLGLGANAMLFLVGWHYVKQGYGMLIVESVLKRCFFNDVEKMWFRYNRFAVWLFTWVYGNQEVRARKLFGLEFFTFGLPEWLFWLLGITVAATTLMIAWLVSRKWLAGAKLSVNGLLAYVTSSYVWLTAFELNPILLPLIPMFHSLQYLAVVWRYKLNKERAEADPDAPDFVLLGGLIRFSRPMGRLLYFVAVGTILGALAFWVTPMILSITIPYDRVAFGPALFLFIFFIFINVRHYFLDNVMWRKENPDIKRHLFSPG